MNVSREQQGFTLIETLVAIALFAIVSLGFYQVMFAAVRGSDTSRSVVRTSEEARLGLNRMVRDTREADSLGAATPTSYRIQIDFDANGTISPPGSTNSLADYEDLTFAYQAAAKTIALNGELLAEGVEPVGGKDVFSYFSNRLEYDWNADGVTSWQELDAAPTKGVSGVGNNNGMLDSAETPFLTSVVYNFVVRVANRSEVFHAQAQLRNRR